MTERSNITIEIVKLVALGGAGGAWAAPVRKAKGWFLEFRLIPVLLWSYTAVVLGTALAAWTTGGVDVPSFAVALGLGGLIQGWSTHAINEIYDWRSGTDRVGEGRALSGGSRVRNLSLLDERDLWIVFAASSAAIAALTLWVIVARAAWLALLIVTGYVLGVAYTAPPIATAYRPFAGEWLGGFPGVLLSGLGAYAIQTRSLSAIAVIALSAHALVCMGMLIVHHYLDAPMDAAAYPPKRTTVVAIGLSRSKAYAAGMAALAAGLYGVLGLVHPAFLLGTAFTLPAVAIHLRTKPDDLESVTRNELRIIQLGIAAGLATAVGLAPSLWPMLPLAAAGYVAHLVVAAPPAALSRAWRRAPGT
jgi:1,4-dihydroxy-2-naphthoate octaprenyltransferase